MEFLYLKASVLQRTAEKLTDYEQAVLCLLRGEKETRTHKTILLDGMDESYTDAMMEDLIQALGRSRSQLSIWFGWRTEHYYQKETERLSRWIDNVLALPPMGYRYRGRVRQDIRKENRPADAAEKVSRAGAGE